ncbi:serine threonine kinase [Fusarium subglutinans]|uniref:Serine threonine kinase n=1 Tax=Gibberella subglutinans TaxID=42677 RepID=A0A8H5V7V2_GIBSU|nr:serine threonine kinase [Fusarium subglutinans]KAF5611479.1 serine threonine kinase [Fusarium subglutinans]
MIQNSGADELTGVTLKDRLEYALLPNGIRQQEQFLPSSCLESICTEVSVFTELSGCFGKEEAKQATSYICDRRRPAKKILAILALINRIELIRPFQNATFCDQDLPLTTNIEESEVRSRWVDDQRSVLLTRSLRDIKAIRDFNLKQWCVNIPFLERDVGHVSGDGDLVLHSDTIMPWESAGHGIVTGGYGYVQKVKIHKDHHSFVANEKTRDVFKQEMAAFRKVRPGPNLLELVSAFEISGKDQFMLLFPWAEGGSMEDMINWPSKDLFRGQQQSPKNFVQWIISQCRGLVEALGEIHQVSIVARMDDGTSSGQDRSFGIHLDIKPANILYFSQETANHPLGVLKIADFGLTRCSQEYRSPEHDIGYIISRKVDIWAFGCVFSELFTWVLLEHKGREDFRQLRKQDALFSGDWNYVQSGENDIEDNFFQRHIELKRTKNFHRLSRGHPKIGYVKRTRAARKEKARLDQANSSAGSKQFEQIPRLKPSVSQWIAKLVNQIRYKNGPTFLGELLEFIEKEMLHPDRIYVMVSGDWSIDL